MEEHERAERLLGHPVAVTLDDGDVTVAGSVAGEPPCTRVAWIDRRAGAILARIACPPGRPSTLRPVVATEIEVVQGGVDDRVIAMRAAPSVSSVRVLLAAERQPEPEPAGAGGLAIVRLPRDVVIIAVDAIERDEPVGRLDAAGIGRVRLEAGRITGRHGAGHDMAAGFGQGQWTVEPSDASFEAGYEPILPGWVPEGLRRGPFHVEPDVAYPFAPPSIAVAWGAEPRRVLLRQAPAPLASPGPGEARHEEVDISGATGILVGRRRFATLVWETADRAFGLQVVGLDSPADVAVRIARSV